MTKIMGLQKMSDEFTEKIAAKISLKIHYKIRFTKFTFQNSIF